MRQGTTVSPPADEHGLVCAFWLDPVEPCRSDAEALASSRGTAPARPIWLHFNLSDVRAKHWLEERSGLPESVTQSLLDPEPRIHVEILDDAVVAVLADLHHDFDRDPEGLGNIRLYLDRHRVISFRRDRLRTADRVRRDLLSGTPIASTGALFLHFLERLDETMGDAIAALVREVDHAEDEILADRYQSQVSVIGRVRRTVARLRRHMSATRSALGTLKYHPPEVLTAGEDEDEQERAASRLRVAVERLESTFQELDALQERTRLLQDEITGRLAEATNRNVFVLSTLSVALLPITLITGIFGMNVGGLPFLNDAHGFKWVMVAMGASVAGALLLLYQRRVL